MCNWTIPEVWSIPHIGKNDALIGRKQLEWREEIPKVLQNTQIFKSLLRKENYCDPMKKDHKKKETEEY